MKFQNGTIKHLQKYVQFKNELRGFNDETLCQRLVLLAEEVGELMHACRNKIRRSSKDNKKNSNLGEELADVLNVLISIGNTLGIDFEKEFIKKMKVIDKRVIGYHK